MGMAFVMKHVVTETKVIKGYVSAVKVTSFTERAVLTAVRVTRQSTSVMKVGVAYAY